MVFCLASNDGICQHDETEWEEFSSLWQTFETRKPTVGQTYLNLILRGLQSDTGGWEGAHLKCQTEKKGKEINLDSPVFQIQALSLQIFLGQMCTVFEMIDLPALETCWPSTPQSMSALLRSTWDVDWHTDSWVFAREGHSVTEDELFLVDLLCSSLSY